MERKLTQTWSTSPPITTKQTSYLKSFSIKKTTIYDVGNLGSALGQARLCGGVNGITFLLLNPLHLIVGSPKSDINKLLINAI